MKYTFDQQKNIIGILVECANENIDYKQAERAIAAINCDYPLHNVAIEVKKVRKYLDGNGYYGYAYPSGWAKALIEVTNEDPKVIQALKEQQRLYKERDGRANGKLEAILNSY